MFSQPRHAGKSEEQARFLLAAKAAGQDPVVYCLPEHAQKWRDMGFKVWTPRRVYSSRGTPAGPKDTEVGRE